MGLLDLFGGDATQPGALYGGLLTPQQNSALGYRGLLAAAGALGQAAMPSRLPIPIGAALGQAAGAMGSAQDEAALNAMRGQLVGLQGQSLASDLAIRKQLAGLLPGLAGGAGAGASPLTGASPGGGGEVSSPAPNASVTPDLSVGSGSGVDPRGKIPVIRAAALKYGVDPDVAVKVASTEGLGDFLGDGGKSGGAFQLYTGGGLGNDFEKDTGLNPLDPKNEDATIDYAMMKAAQGGWGPWNGAKRVGITGFMGIGKPQTTQVAQANTGTATDAIPDITPLNNSNGRPDPRQLAALQELIDPVTGLPKMPPSAAPTSAPSAPPQGLLPPQAPGSDTLRVGGAGGLLAPPQPTATPFTNAPPVNGVGAPAPGPQSGMLAPQAPQVAQAPMIPPAPSGAPGMGIGLPPVPNIDPRALAAASSLAQLGHMGDVFGPLEKFYYQSPGYLAQAGQAKALGEGAGQLPYAGPLAAAKKAAEYPYDFALGRSKFLEGRPGAGFYDPVTQREIFQVPTLQQTVNPDQSKSFTYVQPGLNGGAPTLQPTGAQSELAPGPHAQATEGGKLGAEFGGLPGAQPGAAPPPATLAPQSNQPVPTSQGTKLPPLTEQFMPQSAAELEHAVPAWQKKTDEWNAGIAPARQAEMRLGTIAQAFKLTETGAFETHKAELATMLKGIGIDPSLVMQTNPSAVQMALHDNILTTLPLLKAATPRPSQIEFMSVSENREHPNLQPAANLRMLTEDLALVRQAQQLPADWNAAQQQGWRNPQSFETAWSRLNPLDATRDQVEKEIGPLKGMAQPAAPAGGPRHLIWNPQTKALEPMQ